MFPNGGDLGFSTNALRDWLPRLRTVETAAGYYRREVTVRTAGRSTVVPAASVTDQFFRVLGTRAAAGQLPATGSASDVIVGQRVLHQVAKGDRPDVVGAPLSLSDEPRAIRRRDAIRLRLSGPNRPVAACTGCGQQTRERRLLEGPAYPFDWPTAPSAARFASMLAVSML